MEMWPENLFPNTTIFGRKLWPEASDIEMNTSVAGAAKLPEAYLAPSAFGFFDEDADAAFSASSAVRNSQTAASALAR